MTAWADYQYYTESYLAGRAPTVSETDFRFYAVSATALLQRYTQDAIPEGVDIPEEAKHAACAAVEALAANEAASSHAGVTSEKVGDLSITYESASTSGETLRTQLHEIARTWLMPWIYLGVGGGKSC